MQLIENDPLDLEMLKNMLKNREDMKLVWPTADFPFCPTQWADKLSPDRGSFSFWITEADKVIGHACLSPSTAPGRWVISHLYLIEDERGQGKGQEAMAKLEDYASKHLNAQSLILKVKEANLPAVNCSVALGFTEIGRSDNQIKMTKAIHR